MNTELQSWTEGNAVMQHQAF